jgi:hypothetical protein
MHLPPTRAEEGRCPLGVGRLQWGVSSAARGGHAGEGLLLPPVDRSRVPGPSLGTIDARWDLGPGDDAIRPREPLPHLHECRHRHTTLLLGGTRVHIDRTAGTGSGPGFSFVEVRIYIDERIVGRAVKIGCSLGAGGSTFPAVALIGDRLVLVASEDDPPRLELVGYASPVNRGEQI